MGRNKTILNVYFNLLKCYVQRNSGLRLLNLRLSHILGLFLVVPTKTTYKYGIIFLHLRFLNVRFFLHLRHESLVPAPFLSLNLELIFTTFEFGLHK